MILACGPFRTDAHTVDLTGGAPEFNPSFRCLVDEAVARGKHVIDRCNLTVLLIPRQRNLPAFLAERGVEVVCSLPHFRRRNTDAQRGDGAFERSGLGRSTSPTLILHPLKSRFEADQAQEPPEVERPWPIPGARGWA